MAKDKITYRIEGYGRAAGILDNFSREERYLRSLIASVTGDRAYADGLDYRGCLREGHKIRGIAKKILDSRLARTESLEKDLGGKVCIQKEFRF